MPEQKLPKFKIGDKVKIKDDIGVRALTQPELFEMLEFKGEVLTIQHVVDFITAPASYYVEKMHALLEEDWLEKAG